MLVSDVSTAPIVAKALFHGGRIGLASLFVLGGINKITDPMSSIAMMNDAGLPFPLFLIWAVIALELGLGLIIAAGRGWVLPAALMLMAHTLAANLLFHDFWTMDGDRARLELSLFFKNISVMGGLALVAGLYGARKTV